MKVSATARYVRGSTRKARLVVEAIRGRSVEEAAALLKFMPQHAAKDVAGVLKSAAANAENNLNMATDELLVLDARADEGPTIKRWRPLPGSGLPDPQGRHTHHRHRRRPGGLRAWVTRSTRTGSDSG